MVNKLLSSRRYFILYTEREDLFQIGWIALIRCLNTFDKNRGVKFETYASKAILNAVNKELKRLVLEHKHINNLKPLEYYTLPLYNEYMQKIVDIIENSGIINDGDRKIFWSRFIEGQTFNQIGQNVGFSREYVRQRYNKSIEILKEAMVYGR